MSCNDGPNAVPITSATDEYVSRWRLVSKEQDQILSEVLQKNLELEARVKALEYDNWRIRTQLDKYKAERQTLEEKRRTMKTEIEAMKSEVDVVKVRLDCQPLSPRSVPDSGGTSGCRMRIR